MLYGMLEVVVPWRTTRRLLNAIVFLLDKILHLPGMTALYLNHSYPQWWQFLTHMFAHASWQHISSNAFFLLTFGSFVEEVEGSFGVVAVYILCGLGEFLSWLIFFFLCMEQQMWTSPTNDQCVYVMQPEHWVQLFSLPLQMCVVNFPEWWKTLLPILHKWSWWHACICPPAGCSQDSAVVSNYSDSTTWRVHDVAYALIDRIYNQCWGCRLTWLLLACCICQV